jgi:hypothetical protein
VRIAKIACLCLLGALLAPAQTVNCVVAVVNGRLITLVDVQVVAEFGLAPAPREGAGDDPRLAALEALIDRMVVLEMTRQRGSAGGEEAEKVLDEARRKLGDGEFTRRLRKFGLQERDLRIYVEEGLLFEMALDLRFSRRLPVSRTEVERHYREIYAPEQARRGLRPEPLEKVTELLEARIRDRDLKRQKEAWIKDLRSRADIRINKDCLK